MFQFQSKINLFMGLLINFDWELHIDFLCDRLYNFFIFKVGSRPRASFHLFLFWWYSSTNLSGESVHTGCLLWRQISPVHHSFSPNLSRIFSSGVWTCDLPSCIPQANALPTELSCLDSLFIYFFLLFFHSSFSLLNF